MHQLRLLAFVFGEPSGEGWKQVIELSMALILSSLIGLERELGQKSAGLRTHALVGVGAALFMLVSKYGFTDVLVPGKVILDPSRIAAQIVTGIGFIGGGLIFVRRDAVQGLTTAAVVWVTAAVGAACGAGLPILAVVATCAHFLVVQGYPHVARRFGIARYSASDIELRYLDGRGLLREILALVTIRGFVVGDLATAPASSTPRGTQNSGSEPEIQNPPIVSVALTVHGPRAVQELAAALSEIEGVVSVTTSRSGDFGE